MERSQSRRPPVVVVGASHRRLPSQQIAAVTMAVIFRWIPLASVSVVVDNLSSQAAAIVDLVPVCMYLAQVKIVPAAIVQMMTTVEVASLIVARVVINLVKSAPTERNAVAIYVQGVGVVRKNN